MAEAMTAPTGLAPPSPAAIDDALRRPGAVTQLPVTPQRLRALLRDVR